MKKLLTISLEILFIIIILILVIGAQGLIYWGIGAFICFAFQIPFNFTFLHGIAIGLIVSIISGIFNIKIEERG